MPTKQPPPEDDPRASAAPGHMVEQDLKSADLRQTRESLREARDRLADFFDRAPVGYFILDQHGTIEAVNLSGAQLLGRARGRLVGAPFMRFVDPASQEFFHLHQRRILDEPGHQTCHLQLRTADGMKLPALMECLAVRQLAGEGVQLRIAVLDQRAQIAAEEALRSSRATLRTLYEYMTESVVLHELVLDKTGAPADYRIVDCNHAFCRISGLERDRIVGTLASQLYKGEPPHLAVFARVAMGGAPHRFETYYPTLDRHFLVSVFSPGPGLFASIATDITERVRNEARVREGEERYRTLLDGASDAVFIHGMEPDGRPARFSEVNRAACERLGYTREELLGLSPLDLDAPECFEQVRQAMERLQLESRTVFESRHVARDGRRIPVEINARLYSFDGQPVVMSIVRDLSDRRELEEERLTIQRLESIGSLAAGIAHDFNNALTGVAGYLSLASRGAPEAVVVRLRKAEDALGKAKALTGRLLTFAKGGAPVRERLDLPALSSLLRSAAAVQRPDISCRFHLNTAMLTLEVDPGQLTQAVVQVLSNAEQAMPGGGRIDISVEPLKIQEAQSGIPAGEYVRLRFADSGPGIPEAVRARVFDPYFSTWSHRVGLGLTIVHSIARRHGGTAVVESPPEGGAVVDIVLPVLAAPSRAGESPAAPRRRVLLMDDDAVMREVSAEMIRELDHEIDAVDEGEKAVQLYTAALADNRRYDLVILDLSVPGGLGGRATIERLRQVDPAVHAYITSGYSDDPVVVNFRKYGFAGALVKPYTLTQLAEII